MSYTCSSGAAFQEFYFLFPQSSTMKMMSEEDRQMMEEELKRNLPQVCDVMSANQSSGCLIQSDKKKKPAQSKKNALKFKFRI